MRDRAVRRVVLGLGSRMTGGTLVIDEGGRETVLGDPTRERVARVRVNSERVWPALLHGSNGLGASYARGDWDSPDLVTLMRVLARAIRPLDRARARLAPILAPAQALRSAANTPARARRNARAHYDLGNDLYALFLDESFTYSAAIFDPPDCSLEEAQREKLDRACRRLGLRSGDRVVEIGTGWGSFALHAAGEYGCHVTTTTLAAEQRALATERVRAAGLADRITILDADYRELDGRYDALVSIEMIEAVGWRHFDTYFASCARLLEDDGAMLLQAILVDDRLYEGEKRSRSFANTQIFPGGCLPSSAAIAESVRAATDLHVAEIRDITEHYSETLRRWRERFVAHRTDAARLGYDEDFLRRFELYLAFSEAGFRERRLTDVQMVLAKPAWRGSEELALPTLTEHPAGDEVEQLRRPARGKLREGEDAAGSQHVLI